MNYIESDSQFVGRYTPVLHLCPTHFFLPHNIRRRWVKFIHSLLGNITSLSTVLYVQEILQVQWGIWYVLYLGLLTVVTVNFLLVVYSSLNSSSFFIKVVPRLTYYRRFFYDAKRASYPLLINLIKSSHHYQNVTKWM